MVSSTRLIRSNRYPIKKLCHLRRKEGYFSRHRQTGDLPARLTFGKNVRKSSSLETILGLGVEH
jgi:hypothetical protein